VSWLKKIEELKPGDACEFRFPARKTWRKGTVLMNGGSGYWRLQLDESYNDEETGEPVLEGDFVNSVFIEHIRLPGQTEAKLLIDALEMKRLNDGDRLRIEEAKRKLHHTPKDYRTTKA
jgi:hypothetical protein